MMQIYDTLIDGMATQARIRDYFVGPWFAGVLSDEDTLGMAFTPGLPTRPRTIDAATLRGLPLCTAAQLVNSWNQWEMALGMAAINAFYNAPERVRELGHSIGGAPSPIASFGVFGQALAGKKVGIVGHFGAAPARLPESAQVSMFDLNPTAGDYPASAAEYLLPEQDFIFMTGAIFSNKSAPRMLAITREVPTVVIGPSTPIAACLFDAGVDAIAGFEYADAQATFDIIRGLDKVPDFAIDRMVHLSADGQPVRPR